MKSLQKIPGPFTLPFLLILFCWKAIFVILYKYPLEDMWHQKTLAIHFAYGYGVHYLNATLTDLSVWQTETIFRWPPLNAILIGAITYLVKNVDLAVSIIDCFALFLLITAVYAIVRLLQLSIRQQWFVWLLLLFNPIITDLFSTSDLLSISFWVWSFYFTLAYLANGEIGKQPLLFLILVGFLPAAFRYQYYPLIFIMPGCLLLLGIQLKKKQFVFRGLIWAAGLFILLSTQIIILKAYSGGGIPVKDIVEFSPHNLSRMNPFFMYSFFPAYLIINKAAALFSFDIIFLYQLAGLISLLAFCVYMLRLKAFIAKSSEVYFFKTLTLVSVFSVFLMLCILSVYYRQQLNGNSSFTYVQESRYWGFVFILIPILFVADEQLLNKKLMQAFLIVCIVICTGLSLFRLQKSGTQNNSGKLAISETIEKIVRTNQRPVVLTCFDSDFAMYNFNKPYAVANYDSILTQKIQSSRPVWFFLITRELVSEKEATFIQKNNLVFIRDVDQMYRIYRNQ